jgi:hypothetical protein
MFGSSGLDSKNPIKTLYLPTFLLFSSLDTPDAAQRLISAFTRVFDTLWAAHRGAQTQNRENNPMQSRMGPGSQRSCGLRPRHEKSQDCRRS